MHYCLIKVFDPITKSYHTCGTYKLHPTHCQMPTISEADQTIVAATELLETMRATIPTQAANKAKHVNVLQKLTSIITNGPAPRVGRVPAPRVTKAASASVDKLSPKVVKAPTYVHQRKTRNNTPMPTIMEEENTFDRPAVPDNAQRATRTASLPSTRVNNLPKNPPIAKSRRVNGQFIGSKRNNAKQASRKRMQQLIDQQKERDAIVMWQIQPIQQIDEIPIASPAPVPTDPIVKVENRELAMASRMPSPQTF